MRILIATDVFPPRCGGAGWSAYYLARALRERGHQIAVVRPRFDSAVRRAQVVRAAYDGFPVAEARLPQPANRLRQLVVRNLIAPRLLRRLVAAEARRHAADLIHAQHALTVPAAVAAADRLAAPTGRRIPVVATVRDYWPLCYYSTMQAPGDEWSVVSGQWSVPSGQRAAGSGQRADADAPTSELKTQNSKLKTLALLRGIVTARRRQALGRADAVIAVSQFVAGELARAEAVAPARLHVVPNLVDLPRVDAIIAAPAPLAALGLTPGDPFLLFVGKLEPSKGAQDLPGALAAAGIGHQVPVVVAGSGPLRAWLEATGQAQGLDLRFADWLDNDDVLRLMRGATVLLFPSAWEEPLSRVLLEACAAGATILARASGGTPDILADGQNGRLVGDMDAFAAALVDLLRRPEERARLGAGARATAAARFSAAVVAPRMEALYADVLRCG